MADLEKHIEERANKLLEDQAIKIPTLGDVNSANVTQNSSINKSGEETDEIDREKVGSNMWSDEEKEATPARGETITKMEVRRSNRNLGGTTKI